jgi:hypothetical protein
MDNGIEIGSLDGGHTARGSRTGNPTPREEVNTMAKKDDGRR